MAQTPKEMQEKLEKFFETHNKFQKYYQNLGNMINSFSSLEAQLKVYLIKRTKVDVSVGKAIFSSYTIEQSIQAIKKLHDANKEDIHPHLKYILKQIEVIKKDRNNMIHGETFLLDEEDMFLSTNHHLAYTEKNIKETKIGADDLFLMKLDIEHICKTIQVHFDPDELSNEEFELTTNSALEIPWRYKRK